MRYYDGGQTGHVATHRSVLIQESIQKEERYFWLLLFCVIQIYTYNIYINVTRESRIARFVRLIFAKISAVQPSSIYHIWERFVVLMVNQKSMLCLISGFVHDGTDGYALRSNFSLIFQQKPNTNPITWDNKANFMTEISANEYKCT